ncbi:MULTISPECIES: RNase E specificity factor CsrD [Dickeya]|uniref:Targeting factor for rsmB/csrBC sRNA degradation by RNase E carbon flux regulator indirectly affects CsrA/RsmA function n=1 Tax=Dickeya aquatica TaxID=1401087 RepID=A0A375A651_9GAMM|nr:MULTISPECIES: RNase E specificity factor CsrD [Dickeya]SLM61461.1 Targeting factor for rsmB/csrBC sRNA degradation by RNase E; carbon flux regulator; indirectly affects CsrA/RsmA function [Dickeya aquatica]
MGLTARLSILITLLTALAVVLMLASSIFSFVCYSQQRMEHQLRAVAAGIDQALLVQPPGAIQFWLPAVMKAAGIVELEIRDSHERLYLLRQPDLLRQSDISSDNNDNALVYRHAELPLLHHTDVKVNVTYGDPLFGSPRYLKPALSVVLTILLIAIAVFHAVRWLRRQTAGQVQLEERARRILAGERETVMYGSVHEWPAAASGALDQLLLDLVEAREARSRVDTLIRSFAAQDSQTGLNNRLFFENQLATQLEDPEEVGTHGVVMMIRLPDFDTLQETHGYGGVVEEYRNTLINLLSTFVLRYPSALLARYYHSDFTVLLPHRTLKEADSIASQLVKAIDILPSTPLIDREDILHIGICAYHGGQSTEQVMESVEDATRNAVLQGGNGWCVYDRRGPEKGRGSVKWRTLLEHTLLRGGPRLYQKPAITCGGEVHHREMFSRIYDGSQELLEAEYMPLVQQLGLTAGYDRQLINRVISLTVSWQDSVLAFPITVDSLLQRPFLRWLRETLLQCPKKQRERLLFELSESEVCQYIGRLRPILAMITGLGCRLAVTQAGLTLVSTAYIKSLRVEVIKLHPGLVRSLDKRPENQLFISSLTEACKGTHAHVFASGVRTKEEWQTLMDKGVCGGQGDLFAASEPVSNTLKKYSPRAYV